MFGQQNSLTILAEFLRLSFMDGSKNREGFDSEAFVVGRKVENGTKINGELQTFSHAGCAQQI